jgi:hypothetical protein
MYGTSDDSGDEASTPPRCPACQGKTYYVDPEQTVITCYDCGRYFRRKKPGAEEPSAAPEVPSAPEPPGAMPEAPVVPDLPVPPPPPPEPAAVAAPAYTPPPPPPPVPEPPVPEALAQERGDFDLVASDAVDEPVPTPAPEVPVDVMPAEPAMAPPEESTGGEEHVGCSICGFPMDPVWKVCPNCVSHYETHCHNCGKTMQAWWLICPWCETTKTPEHIHVGK